MADWVSIRADYVSGGVSYSELAERHGVPLGSIKRHAAQEGWAANRAEMEPNRYQRTVRKVLEQKADREASRLNRILDLNDTLLQKAALAAEQLDRKMITHKRKVKTTEKPQDGTWTETTTEDEILDVVDAPLDRQGIKLLASALKDLNDIAKVSDFGKDESLNKARELLEGLPSAID